MTEKCLLCKHISRFPISKIKHENTQTKLCVYAMIITGNVRALENDVQTKKLQEQAT